MMRLPTSIIFMCFLISAFAQSESDSSSKWSYSLGFGVHSYNRPSLYKNADGMVLKNAGTFSPDLTVHYAVNARQGVSIGLYLDQFAIRSDAYGFYTGFGGPKAYSAERQEFMCLTYGLRFAAWNRFTIVGQRLEIGVGLSLNHIQAKDTNYTFWVKLPDGDERVVPLYEMSVEQDVDGFFDALYLGKFIKLTYMGPESSLSRLSYFAVAHFQRNPSLSVNYRINFSEPSVGSFSPGMNYFGLGINYRLSAN